MLAMLARARITEARRWRPGASSSSIRSASQPSPRALFSPRGEPVLSAREVRANFEHGLRWLLAGIGVPAEAMSRQRGRP